MSSKGQITVPKDIRDRLRLVKGQSVRWVLDAESGEVEVVPPDQAENPFQTVLGKYPLPDGMTTETLMVELRGERDPELQNGPGAKMVSLEEYLRSRP